jgi:hypothetical protein
MYSVLPPGSISPSFAFKITINIARATMKRVKSAADPMTATAALDACPVLCSQIGLRGLACLSTCSRSIKDDVYTVLCRDEAFFLNSAIHTAREDGQHKHYQAVAWLAALLLSRAPATAPDVMRQLLDLPAVPLGCAKQMVSAGLRISYAQLLGTAYSMVAGVEVWVQAQHQLGVQTDIPAVAAAICCGGCKWVSDAVA